MGEGRPVALAAVLARARFATGEYSTQWIDSRNLYSPLFPVPHQKFVRCEIVVGEESDDNVAGGYTSHFELYLAAMRQCGSDISRVEEFVARVTRGSAVRDALDCAEPDAHPP